jgi:hypothetical protein
MAWQLDEHIWERKDGASWSTDDLALDLGARHDFRGAFKIVDVPVEGDPINAGNFRVERNIDGAGWVNAGLPLAKNMQPGYTIGPVENFPDYGEWSIPFNISGVWLLRMELDWTNGPYYSDPVQVTVSEVSVVTEQSSPSTTHTEQSGTPTSHTEQSGTPTSHTEQSAIETALTEASAIATSHTEQSGTPTSHTEQSATPTDHTEQSTTPTDHTEQSATPTSHTEQSAIATTVTEQSSPETEVTEIQ